MSERAKHILIAAAGGFTLSSVLLYLSYRTGNQALFPPQAIGVFICMLVRGIHSATKADYALIALPINGLLYAFIIYILLRLIAPDRSRTQAAR